MLFLPVVGYWSGAGSEGKKKKRSMRLLLLVGLVKELNVLLGHTAFLEDGRHVLDLWTLDHQFAQIQFW